ncbi:MerR family transcriptional regulator [Puniceicoccus vermicola]|uniref:MerR family transcriptional regulator n=1 Tax=Puniceicoccus vermicola TaxID=388746 RepID=A0A7X1E587_9BACT|nr:MerR family transcriptional regulator [Puniceicoccus vermicola]MBC2602869.1 MerR family transcriptional regulator [Puniceicoccus vermicola]
MLIGELSKQTGASARSIRHYEKLGIIGSHRAENGYRRYSEETVEWVKAIRFLLCGGLSLSTIARILPALMNINCKLEDPEIRRVIEEEAINVKSRMEQLDQSHRILTAALEKGYLRRPSE